MAIKNGICEELINIYVYFCIGKQKMDFMNK